MFCNECGAKNPDGAKFCNSCGAKLVIPEIKEDVKVEEKKEAPITIDSIKNLELKTPYHKPINVTDEDMGVLFGPDKKAAREFLEKQSSPQTLVYPAKDDALQLPEDFMKREPAKKVKPEPFRPIPPVTADDDGYNDDMDDDVDYVPETASVEQALESLSSSKERSALKAAGKIADPSAPLPLIDEHYFDDILPEIDNEIFSIPKDNILKIAISAVGLVFIMLWLVYWLS